MPAPIIPYQPSNFPSEIQAELDRRKINRSFKFIGNQSAAWDKNTGDWNTYRGPMVSWIRVCSNAVGNVPKKQRFVFNASKGFYNTYGFQPSAPGSGIQIIGYTPENPPQPHTIENSLITPGGSSGNYPIHVATPQISRLEVTVQKELYRRATIEWVCFSSKQLEYMTPFFLTPGITVMIEWGWNHFNPTSLVPLDDINKMKEFWKNTYPLYTDNVMASKGNYEVLFGIVTNFNFSIEGNKIICSTEITSKDKLYTGISKKIGLSVRRDSSTQKEEPAKLLFKSLLDFFSDKDISKNFYRIGSNPSPYATIAEITAQQGNPQNAIFGNIINQIITEPDVKVKKCKLNYIHGVFAGRPSVSNVVDNKKYFYDFFNKPTEYDFDYKDNQEDFWINMGMVVEILNYFSNRDGGGGKSAFYVDILGSVIGAHTNLISCDSRVLIPNYQAPKFHFGAVGQAYADKANEYTSQFKVAQTTSNNKANLTLGTYMYQSGNASICYRNDIDRLINMFRYKFEVVKFIFNSWSVPSKEDGITPDNPKTGLKGNKVEKDRSGLLSNVYLRWSAFKSIVQDDSNESYTEIYKKILKVLTDASGGFWELSLVEAENVLTITDTKYVGKYSSKDTNNQPPTYTFEYYDSDSLLKSLKFRPALSDAQATRAIYGQTNNPTSKFFVVDKNDLLDYNTQDLILQDEKDSELGDQKSDLQRRANEAKAEYRDMVSTVQFINKQNDASLQMTVHPEQNSRALEIVKLILPNEQLLSTLLNDEDYENNQRYCAIQPGIVLELVLQGIGGIRTFQYFLVKNLPKPYSERNVIFRVTDIAHTLESGNWETVIRAGIIPLRKYITSRLNPPAGGWPPDKDLIPS